jgi:small-conductance mechanosensitive channel
MRDVSWSWQRVAVVVGVLVVTAAVAKLIDRRIARRHLAPEAVTRYRILRRSVVTTVVAVGILSALLVIPEVRTVAGGILASSAVVGLVVGFASQRTIGNFVAGLLIAFTQPVRLGDRVEVDGVEGTVEEIGLTYTFIRTPDNARLVIPNEKLASDTIRNATIRSREKLAEITVQIPLESDLRAAVEELRSEAAAEREPEVFVSGLEDAATITIRAWAADESGAAALEADLRLRAHERLRAAGVFA